MRGMGTIKARSMLNSLKEKKLYARPNHFGGPSLGPGQRNNFVFTCDSIRRLNVPSFKAKVRQDPLRIV